MSITVINPFDGQEIEIDLELIVTGVINSDGSKMVQVTANAIKELS